jgi:hypothetical protein
MNLRPNRYLVWPENEIGDFRRADGNAECPICGKIFRKHPYGRVAGTFDPNVPEWMEGLWLAKICDGTYVKL